MLDAIIVGQGIAGSCLAYELLKRGKKIMLVDNDWQDAACLVAAGVLNPITGQRLVKSWRADTTLPYAKKFYSELQKDLNANFYQERKILQLCKSEEEAALWTERKKDPGYADFLSGKFPPQSFGNLNDNFGSFLINFAAWVEAPAIMKAFRKYFLNKNILRLENFDSSQIIFKDAHLEYKILKAKKIIFCEGWKAVDNPFFKWLPYRPAKGEIISFQHEKDLGEDIIHRGVWAMKFSNNGYRCGSTWDRENFRNTNTTPEAKAELEHKLPSLLGAENKFKSFAHEAGVRPCTATTKPHLGRHPKYEGLYSFNGFGSKGYALSPYFAHHFADYLYGGLPLDKEADIARHIKKFFKDQ